MLVRVFVKIISVSQQVYTETDGRLKRWVLKRTTLSKFIIGSLPYPYLDKTSRCSDKLGFSYAPEDYEICSSPFLDYVYFTTHGIE